MFRAIGFPGNIAEVKISFAIRRVSLAGVFFVSLLPFRVLALQPDQIALVVNSNVPEGIELAKFYAAQRHIPDNRILLLDLPKTEHMTNRQYEDQVVPQVRDFLHTGQLDTKVTCLVTFFGVPLAIDSRVNTPEEADEQTDLRRQLETLPKEITPEILAVEAVAKKLNPAFSSDKLSDLDHLVHRRAVAFAEINSQLNSLPNDRRKAQLLIEFLQSAEKLIGDAASIDEMKLAAAAHPTTQPVDNKPLLQAEQTYVDFEHQASAFESLPDDAKARQKLRQIVMDHFGLVQYVSLLRDQVDYLETTDSGAAFDSELAMVHFLAYPHRRFFPNPLHHLRAPSALLTLMVTRLDGPQPETVKAMITTSIKVEEQGLTGAVVIDSQGTKPGEESADHPGWGAFDQNLRDLAKLLTDHTQLKVVLDEKPAVLPPGSVDNVALYVGWYSLRNYVPCCKFNPGAVGYHIASLELVTLHSPGEGGWVRGLLNDGVVGTLGAVAEPYLQSFPNPKEFFPLLLTGKLTLAEVYWRTNPMVSWMQSFIGDPLYNPYKKNPPLSDLDLPVQLRQALSVDQPR